MHQHTETDYIKQSRSMQVSEPFNITKHVKLDALTVTPKGLADSRAPPRSDGPRLYLVINGARRTCVEPWVADPVPIRWGWNLRAQALFY